MRKQKPKPITPAAKENSQKHSRLWIYVTLILLLLFGIVYLIWFYLQKPVVADIRVGARKPSADMDKAKEPKQYYGRYLTFTYSGVYEEKVHTTPEEGPVKESILLSATDLEGQKIAIVVEEREGGDFETSPSFQMRLLKPKEYEKEPIMTNGFRGFLFKKNTQVFEETAFVRKENFIITVSLTSPMNIDGLNMELMNVLRSLKWEK